MLHEFPRQNLLCAACQQPCAMRVLKMHRGWGRAGACTLLLEGRGLQSVCMLQAGALRRRVVLRLRGLGLTYL